MAWLGKFWSNESGASAALYALALPALVGMVGIGFDYSRIASMDSELQNAADQAALAGATQLDQTAGSITRATAAARNGLVTNSTLFANDSQGLTVTIPTTGVFFYEKLVDAEAGTNPIDTAAVGADAKANFIRVKVDTRTANFALTPVVGAIKGTIDAEAVAGIGSALCRTPPLMICNPSEPSTNTNANLPFNADNYVGIGLYLKGGANGGGGSWAPGNFGYLDTVPGSGGGTPDLRKALGWDIPPGECVSKTANDSVDTDTGNKTDIGDSINTRFDIYNGDVSCPTGGKCPASINSTKDVVHTDLFTGTNACKDHGNGWHETSGTRYLPGSNAALTLSPTTIPTSMGHPRDVCHATDPNACSGPLGDGFWDRDAYFASHYRRADGTYWGPTEWTDLNHTNLSKSGGTGTRYRFPTRYQVYLWEIANRGKLIDGVVVLGGPNANSAYGTPQCSASKGFGAGTEPSTTVADRRRLSVAVINCKALDVKGNSKDVAVVEFMDVFLVQPSLNRARTKKDEIYAEIIGKTTAGSAGETAGTVIRRDVPYLVK
ncbi:pilus assembly protein TadG-related protein [Qipengyuania zhejiangensis]|uniref:pilus assembly protein TadG-related protein n=1 Tax=Qipengyuania zhejiangensis TaxID=3077782 RepID=UPI002D78F342|nr:pilus assembly protein TadG-related protein [Qipengyuania sp. Z2]